MTHFLILLVMVAASCAASAQAPAGSATEQMYRASAQNAERKFQHIQDNSLQPHPDQSPTVLTEREINSYLASGKVEMPEGVQSVTFRGKPGQITALTRVDFDQITASQQSSNPLLVLFRGTHDVEVIAHGEGSAGTGRIHVDSVKLDGMNVPRSAIEFFLNRYVTPKYPQVKLDSTFKLPYKIDIAEVGDGKLTVTQK